MSRYDWRDTHFAHCPECGSESMDYYPGGKPRFWCEMCGQFFPAPRDGDHS